VNLPRVVALTGGVAEASDVPALLRAVGRAVDGGLRGVLLREPRLSDRAWLELARGIRALDGGRGLWFAVHDRAHLARAVEADAVHAGLRSLAPGVLRARFGAELAYGLSTHAGDDVALWEAADYLFHGPVRATASKPEARPLGVDGLARAVASTSRPVYALGGQRPEDARDARRAGAYGAAVLSGILGAEDPGAAAAAYVRAAVEAYGDEHGAASVADGSRGAQHDHD